MKLDKYSRTQLLMFGLCVGFSLGGLVYKLIFHSKTVEFQQYVDESIERADIEILFETRHMLFLAEKLREEKYDDAVEHLEKIVERKVESFTDKGRKLKKMNDKELETYNLVKKYRGKYCTEECFEEILYILDEHYL